MFLERVSLEFQTAKYSSSCLYPNIHFTFLLPTKTLQKEKYSVSSAKIHYCSDGRDGADGCRVSLSYTLCKVEIIVVPDIIKLLIRLRN